MIIWQLEYGLNGDGGTAFEVVCAKNNIVDAGVDYSAAAHWARFESHINCAIGQSPASKFFAGVVYSYNFGMSEGVFFLSRAYYVLLR